jgi:hypothetical protein
MPGFFVDRLRGLRNQRGEPADLPDGQITERTTKLFVQPFLKKYSASPVGQIKTISPAIPPPLRGALAIVVNVGVGCGGRGSFGHIDVRTTDVAADGEAVWS